MARPTKLTKETTDKICDAIKDGMTYERACLIAGISQTLFYRWKQTAQQEGAEKKFVEFLEAIKKAEAEFERERLKNIKKASNSGTWQADAWLLERRFKETWARLDKIAPTDPTGEKEYEGLSEEELRRRLEAMLSERNGATD